MKILLVSPRSTVWSSRRHIHMGLGYLAGALIDAGYDNVTLFDAEAEDESLASHLARERYDLVGISSPTPLIYEAWEGAAQAKKQGAITILGGPHLTLMPEESMQRPEVDLVVRGEAEDTLVQILQEIERHGGCNLQLETCNLQPIRGLSWKDASGRIIHNPARPLRKDIGSIPWPAYHLFKIDLYTNLQPLTDGLDRHARAYTLLTSRGCPYQCIYCSKPITGNTWRARSPQDVIAEGSILWEVFDKHRELGLDEIVLRHTRPDGRGEAQGLDLDSCEVRDPDGHFDL